MIVEVTDYIKNIVLNIAKKDDVFSINPMDYAINISDVLDICGKFNIFLDLYIENDSVIAFCIFKIMKEKIFVYCCYSSNPFYFKNILSVLCKNTPKDGVIEFLSDFLNHKNNMMYLKFCSIKDVLTDNKKNIFYKFITDPVKIKRKFKIKV